ncbi:MAG: tetratricopeptide repeat protein [Syntrophales bacterium]|nr:tetratricopeptide repeat protein [Syntrophales bacterium]MDD5642340.1 tetratricopeptide repeat protein [Syntrophales bacterium]
MKTGKTLALALFLVLTLFSLVLYAQQLSPTYLKAVNLAAQGKFPEAKKIFQEILAAEPYHERARRCLQIMADLEKHKISDKAAAHLFQSLSFFYQDQFQAALSQADLALRLNPQYARTYSARGGYYFALGHDKKALADYRRALELDPQNDGAYYNRGCLYLKTEEYGRAIKNFDQAVKINPKFASAFYNRGIAHFRKGEFLWALVDFNRAANLNPRLAEPHFNRAVVLEELGKDQEAAAAYKKFLQLASPALSLEIKYARKRLQLLQK